MKKILIIIFIILVICLLIFFSIWMNKQDELAVTAGQNILSDTSNITQENMIEENQTDDETLQENIVIDVTSQTFQEEVLNSQKTVLVDFYADWCKPCMTLMPTIEEVAKENSDIKVVRINIDLCEDLSTEYSTRPIPTLIVFKNGEEVNRSTGLVDKTTILELVK